MAKLSFLVVLAKDITQQYQGGRRWNDLVQRSRSAIVAVANAGSHFSSRVLRSDVGFLQDNTHKDKQWHRDPALSSFDRSG